ncbi:hypothetical protein Slin15195_G042650 [Septoria linicola]|uniref:Rhodopsin domain-containing protein n=1 Tax=Septoria linicola TaxID=215465 RepID=A0A9Q9AS04_9PEZI|nr:hypothetical protein Slin14017_G046170 [Septoria linicola]USW50946.1 hypothetical protein Slin15195_G042650 [Septoria linicola]
MSTVIFEDHAPNLAATIIILVFISAIVFPLRLYTRIKHNAFGWDDWTMTFAAIPYGALSVFCLGGSFLGIGVHKEKLNPEQTERAMMWFFFFEIFFCVAIIPIKLSISLMLMRVAGPKKKYVNSLWAMTALFVTMNAIAFFYIIFRCSPVSYAWDTTIPGGTCLPSQDLADVYYATTAVNIVADWFCALIPIPLLWNIHLNTNAKLSVGFLLSLGILASLSACIRLKYTVNLNNSDDYLYSVADVVIWGYAENGVGFVVGCISTLRPLFRKVFRLGGNDSSMGKLDDASGGLYNRDGLAYHREPNVFGGMAGRDRGMKTAVTASQLGRKISSDSGSTSEEYILQDISGMDRRQDGIQVHRSVHQTVA